MFSEEPLYRRVAARLFAHGLAAEPWHSGGGVFLLTISRPGGVDYFVAGSSDVTWTVGQYRSENAFDNGEDGTYHETPCPSDSEDVAAIAAAIAAVVSTAAPLPRERVE